MRYLLNAAVLATGAYGTYEFRPASVLQLREFCAVRATSCIGYQETIDMIERWTGVRVALSRESFALEPGDEAMIVRLRYRVDPAHKGSRLEPGDGDWEIARLRRVS